MEVDPQNLQKNMIQKSTTKNRPFENLEKPVEFSDVWPLLTIGTMKRPNCDFLLRQK